MHVTVRLFASYREAVGAARLELDIRTGASARDVIQALRERHPALPQHSDLIVARNREYADTAVTLEDGDELALIPPVSGGAIRGPESVLITAAPLSVDAALAAVRDDEAGGTVAFIGTVRSRSRGKRVRRLDYEAYTEMAESKMREIATRLAREHGARLALHHRLGALEVGEITVVVAASAPHREEAFAAARAGIDELKSVVPIWKKEHTDDGAVWIEDHA